jgi:4-hydroxy-2-oxoheptanedioate aldolase
VLVQVETAEALRDLDAIARTEGVDGVFIGPADLSASLGHRGNPGHPEVVAAIEGAIETILAAGKAPGILTADAVGGRRYLDLGCLFVGVGNDVGLLARAADALVSQFRDAPADAPAPSTGPY